METFQTFMEKIKKGIVEHYGDLHTVQISQIRHNNGHSHYSLTINTPGVNLSPAIPMDAFYQQYTEGRPLADVLGGVIDSYEKHRVGQNVDTSFLLDYPRVAGQIACRLVGRENNQELLKKIPNECFLDMALVCYVMAVHDELGSITIPVNGWMCERWDISQKELFAAARRNTPRLFGARTMDVRQALGERAAKEEPPYIYVLTNERMLYGAICMLYPGVLERIAQKAGGDLYILPSSVHEVIVVPRREGMAGEDLKKMVREINHTQLSPEEVLSDSVYLYDSREKGITLL